MANAYATIASGGYRNRAVGDHQGRPLRRQGRHQALEAAPHEGLHRRPDDGGHQGDAGQRPARHRHRLAVRLQLGRRQDRHDDELHRRVVRRDGPRPHDRGLGRLSRRRRPRCTPSTASRSSAARSPPRSGTTSCRRWSRSARTWPDAEGAVRRAAVLRPLLRRPARPAAASDTGTLRLAADRHRRQARPTRATGTQRHRRRRSTRPTSTRRRRSPRRRPRRRPAARAARRTGTARGGDGGCRAGTG